MRVDSIVVVAPVGQLADHDSSVGLFRDADVARFIVRTKASAMPLDCGLSIGGCARPEVDLAYEAAGLSGGVAATAFRKPLDGGNQVTRPQAVLDVGGHENAPIFGKYSGSGVNEAHCLATVAVEGEKAARTCRRCRSRSRSHRNTSACCGYQPRRAHRSDDRLPCR